MKLKTVPWPRDLHTAAKHAVFAQYLSKWWPIMLRGWGGDVTYAEGFAGPGVYSKDEPGSPVIALTQLLDTDRVREIVKTARLVFVDDDARCAGLLLAKLAEACPPGWSPDALRDQAGIDLVVRRGRCEPDLPQLLHERGAWGRPMLMVLDTWGGAVSAALLRRVARNPGSEVIVTMQPAYFARFAEVKDISHGDLVFGSTDWRDVAGVDSQAKIGWLLQRYRQTVREAGFSHVLDFELIDEAGHALYLVFGTTHRRGLEKMKEAMWEVDAVRGTGYRDPRDPDQQTLDIELEPHTAPLRRLLLVHLERCAERAATVEQLRGFTLFETVFKESQARQVVLELLDAGELTRADAGRPLALNSVVRLP